ncbi:hypothetical protein MNBD_GAMMA26-547 [hydrothermal vent metagenome]|uniref:Uncharacterized protein n=1 Tax=hydrothermal vent metagenome TaxID=652676 RepID=A0A3B1BUK3_9ZZZZ
MLEILLYTVTAIGLYVGSDWILVKLEKIRGKRFAARSIVFFMIILLLSVSVFEILQRTLIASSTLGGDDTTPTEVTTPAEPDLIPSPALNRSE